MTFNETGNIGDKRRGESGGIGKGPDSVPPRSSVVDPTASLEQQAEKRSAVAGPGRFERGFVRAGSVLAGDSAKHIERVSLTETSGRDAELARGMQQGLPDTDVMRVQGAMGVLGKDLFGLGALQARAAGVVKAVDVFTGASPLDTSLHQDAIRRGQSFGQAEGQYRELGKTQIEREKAAAKAAEKAAKEKNQ